MLKQAVKSALVRAAALVAPALWRAQRSPRLLVLMYHRVLPPEHPERAAEQAGMYVSPATLAMHLDTLAGLGFSFHHLDDWVAAAKSGHPPSGLCCCITFDDGWRDNYDHAYPLLRERGVPATIFLVSDMVGGAYSFWPNRLSALLLREGARALAAAPEWLHRLALSRIPEAGSGLADLSAVDAIIDACKSRSDAEMLDIVHDCERAMGVAEPAQRTLMDWREISEMHSGGLVRFGSHTRRHSRLSRVSSPDSLLDEVVGSGEAIAAHVGRPRVFCYPNGDTSPDAVELVRRHYDAAVTTARGWYRAGQDPCVIPRVGVHEDISSSRTAFVARLSGLLP